MGITNPLSDFLYSVVLVCYGLTWLHTPARSFTQEFEKNPTRRPQREFHSSPIPQPTPRFHPLHPAKTFSRRILIAGLKVDTFRAPDPNPSVRYNLLLHPAHFNLRYETRAHPVRVALLVSYFGTIEK